MIADRELERLFRQEFPETVTNLIWQTDSGVYEVFGHYRIQARRPGWQVWCHATEVGTFNSTKTAMSWCIADKFGSYRLAQEILDKDRELGYITADIANRAAMADRSRDPNFRETVGTKLETKIINKKRLEQQLDKCVNLAKYFQQRGFTNETQRIGRGQPNKTSRSSI